MSHVGLEKDSDTDARFYQILVDTIGDLPYRNWVLQTMAIQSMTHHRVQGMLLCSFSFNFCIDCIVQTWKICTWRVTLHYDWEFKIVPGISWDDRKMYNKKSGTYRDIILHQLTAWYDIHFMSEVRNLCYTSTSQSDVFFQVFGFPEKTSW